MSQTFDGESDPDEIEAAVEARLATADPQVTPFRLRNRYRRGVGTWIVSIAVPAGHECHPEVLDLAAKELGMRIEGYFEYEGDLRTAMWNDLGEPPTKDGLPLTNEDQSCAFCGAESPMWVHPLDGSKSRFSAGGFDLNLPTFWTICQRCEELLVAGRDADLARLLFDHESDAVDAAAGTVVAFRNADLGARPLVHVPEPE